MGGMGGGEGEVARGEEAMYVCRSLRSEAFLRCLHCTQHTSDTTHKMTQTASKDRRRLAHLEGAAADAVTRIFSALATFKEGANRWD